MTREEMIFEMAKAIAPSIANIGIALQNNLAQRGTDPSKCTVGGVLRCRRDNRNVVNP